MSEIKDNITGKVSYAIPLSYGFGSVEDMMEAFEAERPFPLNARTISLEWTRNGSHTEEMPRVFGTAVILHANTAGGVDIWDCLYVAWIFERG